MKKAAEPSCNSIIIFSQSVRVVNLSPVKGELIHGALKWAVMSCVQI